MIQKKRRGIREPLTDNLLLLTITVLIFFVMYFLAMWIWGGAFLRWQQVFDMLNNYSYLIIVACGLTIVMICGGIDISVGGVIAFVVMCSVVHLNGGGTIFTAALLAVGIGLAFGIVQGFLISYLEIQPFIITLAGMFFARGMTTVVSVTPQKVASGHAFHKLINARIKIPQLGYIAKNGNLISAKIEYGVIVALVIVIVIFLLLRQTRIGRNFYAVGGNSQSALMLGINVKRTRFIGYVISGLLSGIAGYVYLMHGGAANATIAQGAEMNAIASSIIGGTLLSGGVGNVIGTFFGVMTLTTIKAIVTTSGLRDPWWQNITTGAMLCFFILLQSVVLTIRKKRR